MSENEQDQLAAPIFQFEYVTSTVGMLKNGGIVVSVLNDSATAENMQIIVYYTLFATSRVVMDTGVKVVHPTGVWVNGFTVVDNGEYSVRIRVSSEYLIPNALFDKMTGTTSELIVIYKPGDFAVFDQARKRLW